MGNGAEVADVPTLSCDDARRSPGGASVCVVSDAERVTRFGMTTLVRRTPTLIGSTWVGRKQPAGGAVHS